MRGVAGVGVVLTDGCAVGAAPAAASTVRSRKGSVKRSYIGVVGLEGEGVRGGVAGMVVLPIGAEGPWIERDERVERIDCAGDDMVMDGK